MNREWLYTRYVVDQRSIAEVAREMGVHPSTARQRLLKAGVPMRSVSEAVRGTWSKPGAKERMRGDRNPMRRSEVAARFRGEGNPSKRPEVTLKKNETRWRNGNWFGNGGRTRDPDGYVLVRRPNHPGANAIGYVREHRLVMESVVGRFLYPWEVVHHRNGNKADNRPENLELCDDAREHARVHREERLGARGRTK